MSDKNDGGPAFPAVVGQPGKILPEQFAGMSLRDWLAGQALAGVLANPCFSGIGDEARVAIALDHAEKMIVELAKPQRKDGDE